MMSRTALKDTHRRSQAATICLTESEAVHERTGRKMDERASRDAGNLRGPRIGNVHLGNPWEGRAEAMIAELRRKISNLDQLIETVNGRKI